jgi:hypothetical protein
MSHPPDTDTTIQQLIEPTIDTDAVMSAAAAAYAVGSDPADEPSNAADGQAHALRRVYQ